MPTSTIGTLASEISMRFGFRGLSHVISTGCTSSTDASGLRFSHHPGRHAGQMIAGGVDAPIAPLILRGFMAMRILASRWNDEPERASRPFSRDREGFVIAEGSWFFVLEESEHAQARGATILRRNRGLWVHLRGVIIGSGWRNAGKSRRAPLRWRSRKPASRPSGAVYQLSRHFDRAERPHRDARRETGVRQACLQIAGVVAEEPDRPSAGRLRRGGSRGDSCWPCATACCPPPPMWTCRTRIAISITFRSAGRRADFEYAVANCIAFGSKNSALVLKEACLILVFMDLKGIIETLEQRYGKPAAPLTRDPFEMVLLEKSGYLAPDEKRERAFLELKKRVGTTPEQIRRAPLELLQEIAAIGGIYADTRALRMQQSAELALGRIPSTAGETGVQESTQSHREISHDRRAGGGKNSAVYGSASRAGARIQRSAGGRAPRLWRGTPQLLDHVPPGSGSARRLRDEPARD